MHSFSLVFSLCRISSCKFAVVFISIVFNDTIFHADFFFVSLFSSPFCLLRLCDVGSSRNSLCSVHLMCFVNILNDFHASCNRDCLILWGGSRVEKKSFIIHFPFNRTADSGRRRKKREAANMNWLTLWLHGTLNHLGMLIFYLILTVKTHKRFAFPIDLNLLKLFNLNF